MVHLKKSPRSYSKISAIANLFMQSAEHRLKCDIPVKSKKKIAKDEDNMTNVYRPFL